MMSTNYAEFLQDNEPTLSVRWRGDIERHQCPLCLNWTAASLIADVSGISGTLATSRWACDACWSEWQRQLMPLQGGDEFVTQEEWFSRFLELTGRDGGNRDALIGRQYAQEADRLRGVLSRLDPASPEAVAAQARLQKVLDRSTLQCVWDRQQIPADGNTSAVLSGLPAGTEVIVDGVSFTVDDGDFELVVSTPGAYRVQVRHPRYIWQEWTINAS